MTLNDSEVTIFKLRELIVAQFIHIVLCPVCVSTAQWKLIIDY